MSGRLLMGVATTSFERMRTRYSCRAGLLARRAAPVKTIRTGACVKGSDKPALIVQVNFTMSAKDPSAAETEALTQLFSGRALSSEQTRAVMARLVSGDLAEPAIAAMLVAFRLKGETTDELIGAARALRDADAPFDRPDYLFADTCGTGGDGSGTINVSTAVAFVAAAAGLPVAKHGNRSFSSLCGSADVLERLGAKLDVSAAVSRRALDQTGFCFLFAPAYHPGLRHAGAARRMLRVRTIFNLLGPCLNPAEPPVQLLGVAEERLLEPIAATLVAIGVKRAMVVHGSGLDEVALHGPTQAILIKEGAREQMMLRPEMAKLHTQDLAGLKSSGPEENVRRLDAILKGGGSGAENDAVALNAGALLMIAGLASDFAEGAAKSLDTLRSGAPAKVLAAFVEASRAAA